MKHLKDVILYESENSAVEFKKIAYHKKEHQELIKDFLALANARTLDLRYLITGVKAYPDGSKNFMGIDHFEDDATYQQLIHSNIEPDIPFSYSPFEVDGKTYGVFEIGPCENPPYLMKKGFGKLLEGTGYIRKGTSSFLLKRSDYDHFYSLKLNTTEFVGEIVVTPVINNFPSGELPIFKRTSSYPSEIAEERIRNQIEKHQKGIIEQDKHLMHGYLLKNPIKKKSIDELKIELEHVKEEFSEADQYYVYEIDGATLNFEVEVKGSSYLEDAHFEFIISEENILLADKLFPDPHERSPARFLLNNDEYPDVSIMDDKYLIRQSYGDIRHLVPTHIFQEPLRLACLYEPDQEIIIEVKIFAKNLRRPRVQNLKLVSKLFD